MGDFIPLDVREISESEAVIGGLNEIEFEAESNVCDL